MSSGGQIGTGRLIGQWVRLFCFAMAAEMILEPILCGEHLPFKTYTKVDGLGAGEVHRIVRDSRGFPWFCTDNGLTLFDGRRFLSYDAGNSHLAFPHSNDLLETAGSYWVATNGDGVWRFAPADPSILQRGVNAMQSDGSARITHYSVGQEPSTNRVNVLYKDDTGRVWAGTDGGLFRLEETADKGNFRRVDLHLTSHPENQVQVWALLPDADGSLWVGTRFGLLRIVPSRGTIHYEVRGGLGSDHVFALLRDNAGIIWVGHQRGLAIFMPRPLQDPSAVQPLQFGTAAGNAIAMTGAAVTLPGSPGEVKWFKGASSSLNDDAVLCLQRASDGHIWIGTQWSGVVEFDGNRFRMYGNEQGLTRQTINALAEDDGGLWFGSSNAALRLVRNGIVSYHSADGLGTAPIVRILRDPAGRPYFVDQEAQISRFDGRHFLSVRPNLPPQVIGPG